MARTEKKEPNGTKIQNSLELSSLQSWLWDAACKIRGPLDAPKFKDYILPLVFLKRLSDVFEDEISHLRHDFGDEATTLKLVEQDHKLVGFFIPKKARWPSILKKTTGLGEHLTDAVRTVARENPRLSGVIDATDFNATTAGQRIVDDGRLADLVQALSKYRLGLDDVEPDILGRAYEYLIRKFAEGQGQSAGEFYTPREVAILMAQLLDPQPGMTVYDPACGSSGLLIKCHLRLLETHGTSSNGRMVLPKKKAPLKLFGQEINPSTFAMSRMNAVIHEMEAEVSLGDSMKRPAFTGATGSLHEFDLVTANPMWNQNFPKEIYESDTYNRFSYGIPPSSNGDWGWIQHVLSSLSANGRAAVVLDTGSLFRGSRGTKSMERTIREKILAEDLIETVILLPPNLFYNTDSHGIILFLNKNKSASRRGRVLLINASHKFLKGRPKNFLTTQAIEEITSTHRNFSQQHNFSRVLTIESILKEDVILLPSWHVLVFDHAPESKTSCAGELSSTLSQIFCDSEDTLDQMKSLDGAIAKSPWPLSRLGDFVKEYVEPAKDGSFEIFSCSKLHGIVRQAEKFNHRVASSNTTKYKVVRPDMFAFDPMLLWDGSIGRNHYDYPGVVSPAYIVFCLASDEVTADLLEVILTSPAMRPKYTSISLGTNVRRRKVTFEDFADLEVPLPPARYRSDIEASLILLRGLMYTSDQAIKSINTLVRDMVRSRNIEEDKKRY
jgi:type I restriction enzyme M protein